MIKLGSEQLKIVGGSMAASPRSSSIVQRVVQ